MIPSLKSAPTWPPGRASTMVFSLVLAGCLGAIILQIFMVGARPLALTLDCTELEKLDISSRAHNGSSSEARIQELLSEIDSLKMINARPRVEIIQHPADLDRIAVLGERNSGTNLIETLLNNNLQDKTIAIQVGQNTSSSSSSSSSRILCTTFYSPSCSLDYCKSSITSNHGTHQAQQTQRAPSSWWSHETLTIGSLPCTPCVIAVKI